MAQRPHSRSMCIACEREPYDEAWMSRHVPLSVCEEHDREKTVGSYPWPPQHCPNHEDSVFLNISILPFQNHGVCVFGVICRGFAS